LPLAVGGSQRALERASFLATGRVATPVQDVLTFMADDSSGVALIAARFAPWSGKLWHCRPRHADNPADMSRIDRAKLASGGISLTVRPSFRHIRSNSNDLGCCRWGPTDEG
jgi:hypothetical protein